MKIGAPTKDPFDLNTDAELRGLDGEPFRREGLRKRISPFAVVALLAEASIALPPGPASNNYTILSALLLAATFAAALAPWERLPS